MVLDRHWPRRQPPFLCRNSSRMRMRAYCSILRHMYLQSPYGMSIHANFKNGVENSKEQGTSGVFRMSPGSIKYNPVRIVFWAGVREAKNARIKKGFAVRSIDAGSSTVGHPYRCFAPKILRAPQRAKHVSTLVRQKERKASSASSLNPNNPTV